MLVDMLRIWSLKSIASSVDWWPHWLEVQSLWDNVAIIWKLQNRKELFVVDIIVEFWSGKGPGVERNGVQFAIWCHNWKDSSECVVGSIGLDCNLSVQNPMGGRTGAVVKAFLSASKAEWHSLEKCQGVPLWVSLHEWNCDSEISVN